MCDRIMVGASAGCHLPISVSGDDDSDVSDDEEDQVALRKYEDEGTWMIATEGEVCRWDRRRGSLIPVVPLGRPTYFLETLRCSSYPSSSVGDPGAYIMALCEGGDKVAFHDTSGNLVGRLVPTVPTGMKPKTFQVTAFTFGQPYTLPNTTTNSSTTVTTNVSCWLGCSDGTVRSYHLQFLYSPSSLSFRLTSTFTYRAYLPGSLGHGMSTGVSSRVNEGVVSIGGISTLSHTNVKGSKQSIVVGDSRGKIHFLTPLGETEGTVEAGEHGGVRGIMKVEGGGREEVFVVMSGRCTTVKVKEDGSKNVVRRNNDVSGGPRGGSVLSDNRIVVVGADGTIKVEPSPTTPGGGGRRRGGMEKGRVTFIREGGGKGRYVATEEGGGKVGVKKIEGEEYAGTIEFGEEEDVTEILAGEGWLAAATSGGGKFVEVEFSDGKLRNVKTLETPEELEGAGVRCLAGGGVNWGMGLEDGDVVVGRCEEGQVEVNRVIEQEEGLPRGESGVYQDLDISMDGRWMAGSRGNKNGVVTVWDLEAKEGEEKWWDVKGLEGYVTAVKFYKTFKPNTTHPSNPILTVVLSSGAFYMYDVKERKVTEWVEQVGGRTEDVIPKGMGKGEGRDVVWLDGNKFALVFEGYFQLVDLDASIPKEIFYHPETSMIARAAKKSRKDSGFDGKVVDSPSAGVTKKLNKKAKLREESKRMTAQQALEREGKSGEGEGRHNYNFAQFHDFGNIVRMEYLGGGEIVVVEGTKKEIRGRAKGYGMG
ncbi:hypothetical protein TrCOL_g10289 [Triparma columacea]|uniref:Uncharacterized protein n=1 Tax=Triparma columacea TaxID=722753 RepID=A0A9W7GHN8_9STRA|nr:hypothetical protein TrCOL_g10289 [Triparma columacea]